MKIDREIELSVEYWAVSDEGRRVLKDVKQLIAFYSEDLLDGDIINSPQLEREYARTRGIIEGLKMLERNVLQAYIREPKEDQSDEESQI